MGHKKKKQRATRGTDVRFVERGGAVSGAVGTAGITAEGSEKASCTSLEVLQASRPKVERKHRALALEVLQASRQNGD